MTVAEAILSRRTIFRFKPDPVPNTVVEEILEFGIFAPNHKLTEPPPADIPEHANTMCENNRCGVFSTP